MKKKCSKCKRANDRIYSRKYREDNPEWKKMDNKRNSELMSELVKKYNKKYPERYKAVHQLNRAIRTGKLERKPCIVCENPKSQGHHQDYSKPLEVIWLCAKHHKAVHNNIKVGSNKTK